MRIILLKTMAFLILLTVVPRAHAQTDYLEYRLAQLSSVKNLYNDGIQANFETLKDYLSPNHLSKLADTELYITLDDNIISATAYGHTNSIHIGAATLLFLEELAATLAWYDSTGNKNYQPIVNYVLLLRKSMRKEKLKRVRMPTMPDALGVPSDEIWERDSTDRTKTFAQNFLKSAVTWIVAHEMGHIALGHFDQQEEFSNHLEKAQHNRELEMAADEFATILLSRVNLAPIGMAIAIQYYSLLYPIELDYNYEEDWQTYLANESHPIWPERLDSLAGLFRQYGRDSFTSSNAFEFCAQSLEKYAELLKTRNILDVMILGSENLNWGNIMTFEPLKNTDK